MAFCLLGVNRHSGVVTLPTPECFDSVATAVEAARRLVVAEAVDPDATDVLVVDTDTAVRVAVILCEAPQPRLVSAPAAGVWEAADGGEHERATFGEPEAEAVPAAPEPAEASPEESPVEVAPEPGVGTEADRAEEVPAEALARPVEPAQEARSRSRQKGSGRHESRRSVAEALEQARPMEITTPTWPWTEGPEASEPEEAPEGEVAAVVEAPAEPETAATVDEGGVEGRTQTADAPEEVGVELPVIEVDVGPYEISGELVLERYTCEDCIYANTCPKVGENVPAECGSFQWRAV